MAIPLPTPGTTLPAYPGSFVARGGTLIHLETKSTFNLPYKVVIKDVCDRDAWDEYHVAFSINEMIDCVPVQEVVVTLSLRVPNGSTQAQIDAVLDYTKGVVHTLI